jgi:hypothetical protein
VVQMGGSPGDPRGFKVALRFDPAPWPHTQDIDTGTSLGFKPKRP